MLSVSAARSSSLRRLTKLVQQLEPPFIVMGDVNARSALWYDDCNERRRLFERLVIEDDIVILSDGSPTHCSRQHDSYSVVNLTICSSDCIRLSVSGKRVIA